MPKYADQEVNGEFDSDGNVISPSRYNHTYGYNASGNLVTDTISDGSTTWVKTFTYNASGQLIGESVWVKQ